MTDDSNTHIKRYEHMIGMMGELSYHIPDVLVSFDDLRLAANKEGALDIKSKDLIGLGIAIANCTEGWVEHFTQKAMQSGAKRQEIMETIGVAISMGGGLAIKYGCDSYEAMEQFEARDRKYKPESDQNEPEPPSWY